MNHFRAEIAVLPVALQNVFLNLLSTHGVLADLPGSENITVGIAERPAPAGYYAPEGSVAPLACPAGRYSPTEGNPSIAWCELCPYGTFCSGSGLIEPTGNCDPGFFCGRGSNTSRPGNEISCRSID